MLLRLIFLLLCSFLSALPLLAQDEDEPYQNEYVGGIDLNTNAGIFGGFFFRHSKFVNKKRYRLFAVELVNVKNPKEQKTSNGNTGNSYIYHKTNYLLPLRFQFGRKYVLFQRAEEEGVEVSAILAGGPTLGLLKPYYIQYDYTDYTNSNSTTPTDIRKEQYQPGRDSADARILGSGGFSSGLFHTKIRPGINIKGGLAFELGKYGGGITGIEVGGLLELFSKKLIIIPEASNRAVFSSVYLNLYFGTR
ncbi:MAG TPA: hypothetical protein VNW99_11765 [Cytophagaceae bacterium]|jgi:hypothetical protein|nr:hypothetical protein [Cytophagaceae bacterium]